VRELVRVVAREQNWSDDWLNDGAKGFLVGLSIGPVILSAPGIEVRGLAATQVLAMKLSAWRDDVDIGDARRLLKEISGSREEVWAAIEPYLTTGDELKAQYAFSDLWEATSDKG
jgi:hypothetical protein